MTTLTTVSPANCLDLINQAVNAIAKKSEQVNVSRIIEKCNEVSGSGYSRQSVFIFNHT